MRDPQEQTEINAEQVSNPSFEDTLSALELAVRDLESGRLGLEEALARYEEGVRLIRSCRAQLEQAEQRIFRVHQETEKEASDQSDQSDQSDASNETQEPSLSPFAHEASLMDGHLKSELGFGVLPGQARGSRRKSPGAY